MTTEELLPKVMRYFRPGVLAVFHSQSDKYEVWTDEYSGEVRIRDCYSDPQEGTEGESRLSVAYGFRMARNGERSVAVWAPDLAKASDDEKRIWAGFPLADEDMVRGADPRFEKWVARYIHGDWGIPDGPIARMDTVVGEINAVTQCVVDAPLFRSGNLRQLCFPAADNNHRYYAAHARVFKRLIDKQQGLYKEAIKRIGAKFGVALKLDNDNTLDALCKLLPDEVRPTVRGPLDNVLVQRRLDGHEDVLPEAFPAFDTFGRDMEALVRGLEVLRDYVAERLNVDVAACERRAQAMRYLPSFDPSRPLQPNYAVANALRVAGKEVVRVQAGYRMPKAGRHDSEAVIFEFSDGSLLSIDAVTNIGQLMREEISIEPEALHVTFDVTYVPPLAPFGAKRGKPDSQKLG
jgi:hypothetical protein